MGSAGKLSYVYQRCNNTEI